jgi:NADH dehydrogenase FAD-containing subunit
MKNRMEGAMIERRKHERRAGGSGSGRRASDRVATHCISFRKASSAGEMPERLVIVGSKGLAGARFARFLKLWGGEHLDVTLVEPRLTKGAMSAVGGDGKGDGFSEFFPYDRRSLSARYGVRVVGAKVSGIDTAHRALTLGDGTRLVFDRLEFAPGSELQTSA